MIGFKQIEAVFDGDFHLSIDNWSIDSGQHWAIIGANGSGKSALAALFEGEGELVSGEVSGLCELNIASVSLEQQRQLIEQQYLLDDADSVAELNGGRSVDELIVSDDSEYRLQLIEQFSLQPLLSRGFRKLSTGQTRKLLIVRALLQKPDLLVLDEVYDGLDTESAAMLTTLLTQLSAYCQCVMVCNRYDEVADFISHIASIDNGIVSQCSRADADALIGQQYHLATVDFEVPAAVNPPPPALKPELPLVKLHNIHVQYRDETVFDGFNWTIAPGQHWQLSGPNGSGKTTLLNLINGDHPQCYSNTIDVFGFRRGSGETIWQIKQYIGYVSASLQWQYRVSISAINVIVSGFHDTIGIYQQITEAEHHCAQQWLGLLGMTALANQPFQSLSYGQQRLLLIARALVKHPALLILDEPCQGLDEWNRGLILTLIERVCEARGTTVLYVNHHANDVIPSIKQRLELEKYS
ncbi:ABC transporter ATP-binding protein ModF [Sinobacterium norvegicum]|uniref:ABC transporter ATP-binding protein ModF n=1 Tax=Sinobacterium norvegicum TaxID=1641715 RepID=A0ABM9ABM4_9GAMM|nr:ABC transporter ATP-binding protein ModF [Sinobacterium norvegicum]